MNGNGHSGNGNNGNGKVEENKIEEKQEETKIEEQTEVKTSNKAKIFDILLTGFFLLLVIAAIVYVSAQKKPEPLTELYFEDHKNLPEFSNGDIYFGFVIHNIEGKDMTYNVEVSREIDGNKTIMDGFQITLKDNEKKEFYEKFNIGEFKKARIIVSLVNKNQEIYFWTNYANEVMQYEGLGYGVLDCLPTIKSVKTNRIILNAKGSYAQGWPIVNLYVDGKKVKDIEINSDVYKNYVIEHQLEKGVHVIDFLFNNDYYNSKTKEDRNLYIGSVGLWVKTIKPQDAVINVGKDIKAFNCITTKKDGMLTGNGAFRFKVEIQ